MEIAQKKLIIDNNQVMSNIKKLKINVKENEIA